MPHLFKKDNNIKFQYGVFGPASGRSHNGADVSTTGDKTILCVAAGIVRYARVVAQGADGWGSTWEWGWFVWIVGDDGNSYIYAHCAANSLMIKEGQRVAVGTPLGIMGATGNAAGEPQGEHVHFEVRNSAGTPIDPTPYCGITNAVGSTMNPAYKKDGFVTENGATYYYANSKMVTGWKTISGAKYYFAKSVKRLSKMLTGKWLIGKYYYYLIKNGAKKGQMLTGWLTTSAGNKYYFGTGGKMAVGLTVVSGQSFYFKKAGKRAGQAVVGWLTIDGKKYYFYKRKSRRGQMIKNDTVTIGGKKCKFDKNGVYQGGVK